MKLAPQSREILRQYKALINARRRDAGHPFSVIRTLPAWSPEVISHTLSLVARLDADGYGQASIISVLAMEGAL